MLIWLMTVGEPLPFDGPNERLLRTGILAEVLAAQGHDVVFWSSTFDHVRKQQRSDHNETIKIDDHYTVRLLHGPSYRSNVSLKRIRSHQSVAENFRQLAPNEPQPDLILCSWPLVELCVEAVRFGKSAGVPVVLDVRDMWPDAIVDLAPRILRPMARYLLRRGYREAREAASGATALTGITDPVVDWAVHFADRAPTELDRGFPMGYKSKAIPTSELEAAQRQWRSRDVARDASEFIACFFGTLGRHFELDTVVAAARQLKSRDRKIKLVICGDGPEMPRWKKAAEQLDNLVLPGWVNAAEIQALMQLSTVGLAPYHSTWDFMISIPNKPIEYMSAGLPVISSLQGTLADLLADSGAGLTYANGEAGDLATVLGYCYDHPAEVDRMSSQARQLYENRFVAESVYAQMADHLFGIVNTHISRQAA